MIEILWTGRGGQGAFTAAKILGAAWARQDSENGESGGDGKGGGQHFALAFPSFGPERRGAPVRAFTKLDDKPINNRGEIRKSDYIVYLDDTLFDPSAALSALKSGGRVIVNTAKKYNDPRIVSIDAGHIAFGILKRPIANTAMLGVLSALCPNITLAEIERAIAENMSERLAGGNIEVVRKAWQGVALHLL